MKRLTIIAASTVLATVAIVGVAGPAEARRDTTWPTVVAP